MFLMRSDSTTHKSFRKVDKLVSKQDDSVNFLCYKFNDNKRIFETRYVRRNKEKISAYLSSHTGCKMKCKFCWLTQQEQFYFDHADIFDYSNQLEQILEHYKDLKYKDIKYEADRININFMARGEVFANNTIINRFPGTFKELNKLCNEYNLFDVRFKLSTIMPYTIYERELVDIFTNNIKSQEIIEDIFNNVEIYYSLYSIDDKFKKNWMPNAMPYKDALIKLKRYQEYSSKIMTFHWTFIENENDNIDDVKELIETIRGFKFKAKFNLVAYNPHENLSHTRESPRANELFKLVKEGIGATNSKNIHRIGYDVAASCGTFINY